MYMSGRHQEGLAHLLYGINEGGGFVALTGEVGTGKTTICHCLLQDLPKHVDIAMILNPKMNALELLATICDELSIDYNTSQPSLKNLVDALNQYLLIAHAKGRRTVLLIDEAQNLSMEVLEQIRLLTNLETSKSKLLQIILVGQPELQWLLRKQELRQLNQRITARYHLLPLSLTETREYIRHRLYVCNGDTELFKATAIKKVYQYSSGIPRIINILCDRALLGAYAHNARVITPSIIDAAARETLAPFRGSRSRKILQLTLLLVSCVAFGLFYFKDLDRWVRLASTIEPVKQLSEPSVVMAVAKNVPPVETSPPIAVVAIQPAKAAEKFDAWLVNPDLTLSEGIENALKVWGQSPPDSGRADCNSLQKLNFSCVSGSATWKDLMSMRRPVILEFTSTDQSKRYLLMTGIKQGQAIFQHGREVSFPVADVLRYWNGRYLIIWHSSLPNVQAIYPGQTSDDVLWLRQQLTTNDAVDEQVSDPRFFDSGLLKRVKAFQLQHHLTEDGIAGTRTLFYLDNLTSSSNSPRLIIAD
ncbi:ExeA family protein [Methylicorpusculum sp.]|nr:AAA family ATPase [Methylicorpusculum sp.]MDP2179471.1 AAA family ATPase [Methylicorpusculum sp.]MDZ4150612.1 AAA family ATPase [Methylicorpusculum sp.]